jgi:hypothetical protein
MPARLLARVLAGLLLAVVVLVAGVVLAPSPAQAGGLTAGGVPLSGAVVPDGSTIRLQARGAVSVSWVVDGVYLGRDTRAPFDLVLDAPPGRHKIKARSETASGRETTYQVRFRTVPGAPVAEAPRGGSSAAGPRTSVSPSAPPSAPPPASPSRPPILPATPPTTPPTTPSTAAPVPPTGPPTPSTPAGGTVRVTTAAELRAALAAAVPGQVIELADGVYEGQFTAEAPGSATAPVVLRGSRNAVLDGGGVDTGYALHLDGADHWRLEGFSVRGGQKGIVLDEVDHAVLSSLDVGHTGMEAVHFRSSSSDNRLEGSSVHHTGLVEPGFGEGVYIGSATSNWDRYGADDGPDRSDRNVVAGNRIYAVTAENIDVKEGTTGGVISGNTFDGAGMTGDHYADSWIDLKGNGYLVAGNRGEHTLLDGFQTHVQLDGWGRGNSFRGNELHVNGDGMGINIHRGEVSSDNVVGCDNVVIGAGEGSSNIPCR